MWHRPGRQPRPSRRPRRSTERLAPANSGLCKLNIIAYDPDGNLTASKEPKLQVVTTAVTQNLTFTITSLPSFGTLRFGGNLVTTGQTFTSPPTLLYTPNLSFTGNDSFVFRVTQGALSDLATINIQINAAATCEINGRPVGCAPN